MRTNFRKSISLLDLGMAYRKAKVDAFYSTSLMREAFLEYEHDLHKNLKLLYSQLQTTTPKIKLGIWTLDPKGIDVEDEKDGFMHSCPKKSWQRLCEKKKPSAEFRLMAQPSVDFHVLSSLWIAKVGCKYDDKLSDCAYGNRLRRTKNRGVNTLSLGSIEPYLKPFRDWRDKGIRTMKSALDDNKNIVAVTADVSAFYHELNPSFMLDDKFLEAIGLDLSQDDRNLTILFIGLLKKWAQKNPLQKGLPVGLLASAIIANMALIELDQKIEQEIVPLYYGRYVDDIILVMENNAKFNTSEQVWEWIFKRSDGLLKWQDDNKTDNISFVPEYLNGSNIHFSNKKNKVFLLEGNSGLTLIDSIAHQIHQRASEWRALPSLPQNPAHVANDLLAATQQDGETADNLRKADSLSLRRAGFAIKLRDFEAYARDLPADAWHKHRHAFFDAVIGHVLVLPTFFDLAVYLPRILRMAVACEDFKHLKLIIKSIFEIMEQVNEKCTLSIKACASENYPPRELIMTKWTSHLLSIIEESFHAAFPLRLTQAGKAQYQELFCNDCELCENLGFDLSIKKLQSLHQKLFIHDLAELPFRYMGLPNELVGNRHLPAKKDFDCCPEADSILSDVIVKGLIYLCQWTKIPLRAGLPYGLLFATRPFSVQELYLLHKAPFVPATQKIISEAILALRGFGIEGKMPCNEKNGLIVIPLDSASNKQRIALASLKTKITSWRASVMRQQDPDADRYRRLTGLINNIMRSNVKPDYVIFPELSVPVRWFMGLAHKMQGKGISLICGVEYLHHRKKIVNNQVWAALAHNGLGFPSMAIVRQDKQRPALHEEQELNRLDGLTLVPGNHWEIPPVIRHGEFQFAILICSELTNIAYRAALRGKIDALFVPEWNQDTETFNSLVESAALDIHAYIIQCNDRQYGDSRIRAPYKESWQRDLVRIKGGIEDYFVIGDIDIASLRSFQSNHRSPDNPFKPVPDGFEIAYERKTLPSGDGHE